MANDYWELIPKDTVAALFQHIVQDLSRFVCSTAPPLWSSFSIFLDFSLASLPPSPFLGALCRRTLSQGRKQRWSPGLRYQRPGLCA